MGHDSSSARLRTDRELGPWSEEFARLDLAPYCFGIDAYRTGNGLRHHDP
jgi:hypothetical protein